MIIRTLTLTLMLFLAIFVAFGIGFSLRLDVAGKTTIFFGHVLNGNVYVGVGRQILIERR